MSGGANFPVPSVAAIVADTQLRQRVNAESGVFGGRGRRTTTRMEKTKESPRIVCKFVLSVGLCFAARTTANTVWKQINALAN